MLVFSDKTDSSLNFSAFIDCHIHYVFLNMSHSKREWLVNNGYTIIGFIPPSLSEYDVVEEALLCDTQSKDTDRSAIRFALDDEVILR